MSAAAIHKLAERAERLLNLPVGPEYTLLLQTAVEHSLSLPSGFKHTLTLPTGTNISITLPIETKLVLSIPSRALNSIAVPQGIDISIKQSAGDQQSAAYPILRARLSTEQQFTDKSNSESNC